MAGSCRAAHRRRAGSNDKNHATAVWAKTDRGEPYFETAMRFALCRVQLAEIHHDAVTTCNHVGHHLVPRRSRFCSHCEAHANAAVRDGPRFVPRTGDGARCERHAPYGGCRLDERFDIY
jgi:hypothetical protein